MREAATQHPGKLFPFWEGRDFHVVTQAKLFVLQVFQ